MDKRTVLRDERRWAVCEESEWACESNLNRELKPEILSSVPLSFGVNSAAGVGLGGVIWVAGANLC